LERACRNRPHIGLNGSEQSSQRGGLFRLLRELLLSFER
jgi:hypothetical protein